MKHLVIITTLTLTGFTMSAQEFSIDKLEINGESVIIYYNLVDTAKSRTYTINVFSSRDNFISPLQKIKGDVGLEVRPGTNKRIIWASKEELGSSFNGDIELEIRGRVYIPFIRFDGFEHGLVFKRGKPKSITWSGGTRQNILNFALYKGDNYVDVIPNVANSGSYDMILPTTIKPGKDYSFKVSDSKNKDQVMKTSSFIVRRKVPLLIKLLPAAVIGAMIPALAGGGGAKELKTPPDPPTTK